jgi:hypothetical protein
MLLDQLKVFGADARVKTRPSETYPKPIKRPLATESYILYKIGASTRALPVEQILDQLQLGQYPGSSLLEFLATFSWPLVLHNQTRRAMRGDVSERRYGISRRLPTTSDQRPKYHTFPESPARCRGIILDFDHTAVLDTVLLLVLELPGDWPALTSITTQSWRQHHPMC